MSARLPSFSLPAETGIPLTMRCKAPPKQNGTNATFATVPQLPRASRSPYTPDPPKAGPKKQSAPICIHADHVPPCHLSPAWGFACGMREGRASSEVGTKDSGTCRTREPGVDWGVTRANWGSRRRRRGEPGEPGSCAWNQGSQPTAPCSPAQNAPLPLAFRTASPGPPGSPRAAGGSAL